MKHSSGTNGAKVNVVAVELAVKIVCLKCN